MAKEEKESKQPFQFPQRLLEQIQECSNSYLLFTIDENGSIIPYYQLDSEASIIALSKYAQMFSTVMFENLMQDIDRGFGFDEELDDNDDEINNDD